MKKRKAKIREEKQKKGQKGLAETDGKNNKQEAYSSLLQNYFFTISQAAP